MFEPIFFGIAGIIDVLLCCDLFHNYYEWRIGKKKTLFFSCLVFCVMAIINATFVGIFIKNPVIENYERIGFNMVFGLTLCFIGFRAKPLEIILLFGIFYIFEVIAEAVYMFILAVFRIEINMEIFTDGIKVAFCVLQKFLTLLISKIYQRIAGKRKRLIEGKLYACLLFLPLVTIFLCVYLYRMDTISSKDKTFLNIMIPILIFSNFLVLAVVEKMSRLQNDHYELDFYKSKVQMEKQYYDHLDELEQKQVSVRHDIKHYVSVMKVFVEENRTEELRKLLDSFEKGMEKITPHVYTNNRMVNAILSEKKSVAERKGIFMNFTIEPNVDLSFISDIDSISLFGNLIDNAVRAESEAAVETREVVLKLFEGDGQFNILNIINHFAKVEKSGGTFITTKKEDGIHGIGLKNVRAIIQKYHGIFNAEADGGVFEVTVCLPKSFLA